MKILMVNKFLYEKGGSETYMVEIGKYLNQNGHQVEYFGMMHPQNTMGNHMDIYTKLMDFHTGKLERIVYPFKIIYSLEAKKKIRKLLEDFQPDVVHLNNFNYQLTPSIIYEVVRYRRKHNQRIKIIYTAHDFQLVCPNHLMYNLKKKKCCRQCLDYGYLSCIWDRCIHGSLLRSLLGGIEGGVYNRLNTYRYIDKIICPSNFMRDILNCKPVFGGKTVTLHNFISQTRREPVLKQDYVLYFGRFSEEKGIRTLVNVCKKLPEIPFIFIGTGPLAELTAGIKNISNLGFMTKQELEPYIRRARFSLCVSEWYENCPFTVLESELYGTPVIGANIGGIPELITDGENGELFESGNESELEMKIRDLWGDTIRCEQYAQNCLHTEYDTISEYCHSLLRIYGEE